LAECTKAAADDRQPSSGHGGVCSGEKLKLWLESSKVANKNKAKNAVAMLLLLLLLPLLPVICGDMALTEEGERAGAQAESYYAGSKRGGRRDTRVRM